MNSSVSPARRALPDDENAQIGAVVARRALPTKRRSPLRLQSLIAASAVALVCTAGVAAAAQPPQAMPSSHSASIDAGARTDALSRGSLDRSTATAGPELDDSTPTSGADQNALQARVAALAAQYQDVRDDAVSAVVRRFADQEAQRVKSAGATPKTGATPTDGFANLIYPDGVPANPRFVLPVNPNSYTLSCGFGSVGSWGTAAHNGQDFAAAEGTDAVAVTDAIVGVPINETWPGNHVVLHLADGSSLIYGHLHDVVVHPGQIVHAGDLVGHVGNTGRSFGAHLHLQYSPNGVYPGDFYGARDPMLFLRQHGLQP